MKKNSFKGFPGETLHFLNELHLNNNKTWFEANRDNYKFFVHAPFIELGHALIEPMAKIDPEFELRPEKIISRIHRDIRFSRDKSPYRSNVWITYKRQQVDWMEAPAFFFELMTDSYRYGMGFYSAGSSTMNKYRETISLKRTEFEKITSSISKKGVFTVEGEVYKRKIPNDLPENLQEWYQKKNLYLMCSRDIGDELFTGKIADILIGDFKILEPLYRFLWSLKLIKQ
jgi:uncharacterized protein (TIGR02453 family)